MEKKRCTAIVLAAGRGSRMQSDVAKQYMNLHGKPLIWYPLNTVEESAVIDDCILVVGAEDVSYTKEEIVNHYGFRKVDTVVAGGKERYDSVYHALRALVERDMSAAGGSATGGSCLDGYVFIQDGARPFLTEEILERCLKAVEEYHACVAGMPVKDTIKLVDENGFAVQTPNRKNLWQVQTPQVFDAALIVSAYEKLMREKEKLIREGIIITDDAMVVENLAGHGIKLVEGTYQNIKITTPEDMIVAEAFLHRGYGGFRAGEP